MLYRFCQRNIALLPRHLSIKLRRLRDTWGGRPTHNLHQCLNIMDSEPTNKLFCVSQQHVSIHQPTQRIQIYTIVMFPH